MTDAPEKARESLWLGILPHRLAAHSRWYRGGRVGDGRIVLADQNLQGARVSSLQGARFERCDFSGGVLSLMSEIELVDCTLDDAAMNHSSWERARLSNCRFRGAWLGLANFESALIDGGDWLGAYLERVKWRQTTVRDVSFRAAMLVDGWFDDATFVNCSFRFANLGRKSLAVDMARCPNTRFERCDFRDANLSGLRLNNTTFDRCLFSDTTGIPAIEGPYTVIAPDFSRDGDGSDVRDPDALRSQWERGAVRR